MAETTDSKPFPGLLAAPVMTAFAATAPQLWWPLVRRLSDPLGATAIGWVLGYGLIGALAVHQVERPWRTQLGLRLPERRSLLPTALAVLALPLLLQVQALVGLVLRAPAMPGLSTTTHLLVGTATTGAVIRSIVLFGIILPVLIEWFFRGVIQQGLVRRVGPLAGLVLTASLYAAAITFRGKVLPGAFIALLVMFFFHGLLLGALRLSSGSLVPPLLVHAAHNVLAVLLLTTVRFRPMSAVTVPGRSVPLPQLILSIACVTAAVWILSRAHRQP